MPILWFNFSFKWGNFQWKPLQRNNSVDNRRTIVNRPSEFLPLDLPFQWNHRTSEVQLIWTTIIYIKGGYKNNNHDPDLKKSEAKQVSSDSYYATACCINNCSEIKWPFLMPGGLKWVNILDPWLNQDHKIFFLKKKKKKQVRLCR